MGISMQTWSFLQEAMEDSPPGTRICELGNQHIRRAVPVDFRKLDPSWRPIKSRPAKLWFEAQGWEHVSIDLNGRDGALKLDLTKPLLAGLFDSFHVVTNFGTSEHVADQYECFRNIHRLCRVGGRMIHAVPLFGHWLNHSPFGFDYTMDFFFTLAEANGYTVLCNAILPYPGKRRKSLVTAVLRRRKDVEFENRANFEKRCTL